MEQTVLATKIINKVPNAKPIQGVNILKGPKNKEIRMSSLVFYPFFQVLI